MQTISMNRGKPVYITSDVESKGSAYQVMFYVLLVYLSFYGLVSVYVDNIVFRSLKDVGMLLLAVVGMSRLYRGQPNFIVLFLFLFSSILFIGSMNLLLGGSIVSWVYGVKVTFLPMLMLFAGMYIAEKKAIYTFARTNLIILFLLITGWLIQYSLGIDKLISLGFVYGVNIKHYLEGVPRLNSITVSPDSYAYALLITGLIAEKVRTAEKYRLFQMFIRLLVFSFLLLSTIRSALVFWIIYQIVTFVLRVRKYNRNNMLLLSAVFLLLPGAVVFGFRLMENYNLLSINSMLVRFQSWGSYLTSPFTMNGVIGNGIGAVGAASRRTHMLGLESRDYPVDNQYFSFYEQIGWIGIIYLVVLFAWMAACLHKRMISLPAADAMRLPQMAIALLMGAAAASFTTNVLELFPGNVSIWLVVGMALYQQRDVDEIPIQSR
ncbi:hypothetical protein [Paenibacillus sp. FSL R7-0652]|uniref:hypothetical protein n=1 Tax=Paenibacillus sp. FSL R7-0652 TaxID=2921687 RepID=UPI00315B296B